MHDNQPGSWEINIISAQMSESWLISWAVAISHPAAGDEYKHLDVCCVALIMFAGVTSVSRLHEGVEGGVFSCAFK